MSKLPDLREILGSIFPSRYFLPGLKVGKGRKRVFSIRLHDLDDAVGLKLDAFENWPPDTKRCDGLFLCWPYNAGQLVVVLVELKGGHAEHAIEQIKTTSNLLCKKGDFFGIHSNEALLSQILQLAGNGHGARVLAYIIAKKKLGLRQQERANLLRNYGIRIHFTDNAAGTTCQQLLAAGS